VEKRIFKAALSQFVPDEVVRRPKMGFSVPLASWLRRELRDVFESAVLTPPMEALLDLRAVRRIWSEHQSGLHNHDRRLWNLLILAQWHARHGRPAAEMAPATAV
jgi:asparagine synthase (glutamine-hydrolysing)